MKTLESIVSQPTAPFHEERVCHKITSFLKEIGVPFEIDRWGNIIAHYQKGRVSPPLALMAHTDHPALELTERVAPPEIKGANWTAKLMGGVASRYFDQPSPVLLFTLGSDKPIAGEIVGHSSTIAGQRGINLYLNISDDSGLQAGDFGIWHLPNFQLSDGFIYARVIDDLVGCTATLLTLWKLVQEGAEADLYGLFTRAEEVGLVGATLLLQNQAIPKNCFVISLEASKTLPGALQGEGPVIRVGDRGVTFSETAEFVLKAAANKMGSDIVKVQEPKVKIQRQLMSGGYCEASAAVRSGYNATGLAFPLGNYHNMAADGTLQMENIHEADFITGVELLYETALLMAQYEELLTEQFLTEDKPSQDADRLLQTADYIKSE